MPDYKRPFHDTNRGKGRWIIVAIIIFIIFSAYLSTQYFYHRQSQSSNHLSTGVLSNATLKDVAFSNKAPTEETFNITSLSTSVDISRAQSDLEILTAKVDEALNAIISHLIVISNETSSTGQSQKGYARSSESMIGWFKLSVQDIDNLLKTSVALHSLNATINRTGTNISNTAAIIAAHRYQCSSSDRDYQYELSKIVQMDICSELEWFKLVHIMWPQARTFLDVGANKGYVGAFFLSLWGLQGSYGFSPKQWYDLSMSHKVWGNSRNPGGFCNDGHDQAVPLYCPPEFRDSSTGHCEQPPRQNVIVHSFEGSSYLRLTHTYLMNAIQPMALRKYMNSHWKFHRIAVSDKSSKKARFSGQTANIRPGFEGGRLFVDAKDDLPQTESVTVTTVDDFVVSQKISVDILKVDVEGNDQKVIDGAFATILSQVGLFVFEGYERAKKTFPQTMTQYGERGFSCYSTSKAGLFKWHDGCMTAAQMDYFRPYSKGNIFCVSRERLPLVVWVFDALSIPSLLARYDSDNARIGGPRIVDVIRQIAVTHALVSNAAKSKKMSMSNKERLRIETRLKEDPFGPLRRYLIQSKEQCHPFPLCLLEYIPEYIGNYTISL